MVLASRPVSACVYVGHNSGGTTDERARESEKMRQTHT